MSHDNGGDAFPTRRYGLNPDGEPALFPGMTLHDYFMAHAPAEPQSWFVPVLDVPKRPTFEESGAWSRDCVPREISEWQESILLSEDIERSNAEKMIKRFPGMSRYVSAYLAYRVALSRLRAEREKQRYIQWPAAWATEMIKEKRRLEAADAQ